MNTFKKVKIGDVCTITKGATGIKKAVAGEYPMVTLAEERTTHNEFQFDCEAVVIPLVSSTGHGHASMKRVHYQEGKFAIGSILCAVVPNDPSYLNPKYLHIYLSYLKDKLLVPLMRGAANVSLSISNIKTVEVIVPPIERQLEIIELEKVLRSQKEKLDEQNSFQQSHLNVLRQQILQDAISGKLTADWRAGNPDTEPASKLLEQIKAEKEKLIAEKKIKKEKTLPKISEDEMPFELPDEWEWYRLGEIFDVRDGTHDSPKYVLKGYPLVTSKNLYSGKLDLESVKLISEEDYKKINQRSRVERGDILFAMIGSIGNPIIVDVEPNFAIKNMALFKQYDYGIMPVEFLYYFLVKVSEEMKQIARGGIQKFVSLTILRNYFIPLPPRAEQMAIVAKVERLMGYVYQLEEKTRENANNAETLMQAFLSEVFKGNDK